MPVLYNEKKKINRQSIELKKALVHKKTNIELVQAPKKKNRSIYSKVITTMME